MHNAQWQYSRTNMLVMHREAAGLLGRPHTGNGCEQSDWVPNAGCAQFNTCAAFNVSAVCRHGRGRCANLLPLIHTTTALAQLSFVACMQCMPAASWRCHLLAVASRRRRRLQGTVLLRCWLVYSWGAMPCKPAHAVVGSRLQRKRLELVVQWSGITCRCHASVPSTQCTATCKLRLS
jgi:hypothetical protein